VEKGESFRRALLQLGQHLAMQAAKAPVAHDQDVITRAGRLGERGFDVTNVDISELEKAEAGLTCMSLISEPAAQL